MKIKGFILLVFTYLCLFPAQVFASTMVPARLVLENNGFTIHWNGQGITATDGEKTLKISLNNNVISIDDMNVTVDQSAVIINNQMYISQKILVLLGILTLTNQNPPQNNLNASTMVPARLVLENNGFTVHWDGQSITATDGEKTLKIFLNNNVVSINGMNVTVDQPTVIINNQMYISQKIFDLLGILTPANQISPQDNLKLTWQAHDMVWDIKTCTDLNEYYAVSSSNGVQWLVPEVNRDLINSLFNYFNYSFNQAYDNLRIATSVTSSVYQELIDNISNGASVISLPVEERLSKAVVNFAPSYAQNKNNMNAVVALEYLNGKIVQPGEVFSFNREAGPRTLERGFYVGYSINGREMVPDVGGGVCRASTVLYNAVLDGQLPAIERHSHSLPVSYVPKGRDATVAWDIFDFKFKNNLPYPIKISTEGSTTLQLVVELWKIIS